LDPLDRIFIPKHAWKSGIPALITYLMDLWYEEGKWAQKCMINDKLW
jgi:hypothetical protein